MTYLLNKRYPLTQYSETGALELCSGRIHAKTSTHDGVWVSLCTTCKENKTRSVNEVESLS